MTSRNKNKLWKLVLKLNESKAAEKHDIMRKNYGFVSACYNEFVEEQFAGLQDCKARAMNEGRRPTLACMMVSQDLADVFLTVEKELAA